ncbi:hydroxymyristoyl-ACP dehydratase [Clostridium cylindrosporum]|nr:hydroxymyristoyl-ACP dehydratase [Clostridium cylindrosporum]
MTNINCSEYCKHERNGKCSLTHITLSSSYIGYDSNCAYFHPINTPPNIT